MPAFLGPQKWAQEKSVNVHIHYPLLNNLCKSLIMTTSESSTISNEPDWIVDKTYTIRGTIVHGDERGRTIGFPTANITIPASGPEDGVWAGLITLGKSENGPTYLTAISVGTRPTFYSEGIRLLEAHLLDFEGDIYDEVAEVTLMYFIRGQVKFTDSDQLITQIKSDVAAVREWAQLEGPNSYLGQPNPGVSTLKSAWRGPSRTLGIDKDERNRLRIQEREKRRNELIHSLIRQLPTGQILTYQWLSTQSGIPIDYLKWKHPDLKALITKAEGTK